MAIGEIQIRQQAGRDQNRHVFTGNSYNLNVGSAMSLVLMIIVLLCMSFTSSFDEDEMEGVS